MAKPQRITFLKVNLKDQPGSLLAVLKDLKAKNIGLKSLWGFGKNDGSSDVYAIPKDVEKLKTVWKASGMQVGEGTGFFFKGTDTTGVLLKDLEALAQANVNMTAILAIAVSGKFGSLIWVNEADVEKAAQALGAK